MKNIMSTNELQIFENTELGSVRTIAMNGEPYFVGKDVAAILGYTNPSKALADHVEEEDKLNNESLLALGQRGGWLINESGLYSLILSSKMPNAKKFKRWVTSEVLPQIRQTGGYIPLSQEDDEATIMAKALLIAQNTIQKKEQLILQQQETIKTLKTDNKALSSSILEWEDRSKLNAGIRKLSQVTGSNFASVWNLLYSNLKYGYHIDLKSRKKSSNGSYISTVKQEEWSNVIKVFSAICEELNCSPTEMIERKLPA